VIILPVLDSSFLQSFSPSEVYFRNWFIGYGAHKRSLLSHAKITHIFRRTKEENIIIVGFIYELPNQKDSKLTWSVEKHSIHILWFTFLYHKSVPV
jgi:hypothetical protein